MPESVKLEHAQLRELNPNLHDEKDGGKQVSVQFNPETLKVTFANQIATPSGEPPSRLFVGAGSTKLVAQLWFDISSLAPEASIKDVRDLTNEIVYFITPKPVGSNFIPPATRFIWGSFTFDGIVDSIEETLEFFSNEGRPLRASIALNMSAQKIPAYQQRAAALGAQPPGARGGPGGLPVGISPLTLAQAGVSLQSMAEQAGRGDWQAVASANRIENPRLLEPGRLIDLNT